MATSFPTSIDTLTNPTATDTLDSLTVPHDAQHTNANDAIEALQAKVGINGSSDVNSLDYKVAQSLPKTGGTMTGELIVKEFTETGYTITGTTPVIDPANGSIQKWVLTGNSTPTSNLVANQSVLLKIDDGTAYTINWASVVTTWVGGTAPTLPTTGYAVIVIWKDGDATYGVKIGDVA